jgi:hypothetical protein|tara:strand:+ start:187 stop:543 length:357 start_codon:yes stop_codon:yes gene_type:complete
MTKPIFANTTHQILINDYLNLMLTFAKEISTKSKYQNFKEVMELVIEYHNSYGEDVEQGNWNDWLMIIPINTSVMVNGFFAGIYTKGNSEIIKSYKLLLDNSLELLVRDLRGIDYNNE